MPQKKAAKKQPAKPKNGKGPTLINFVLDKSGSMASILTDTIGGFNTYLRELKKDGKSQYQFSLTLFDTHFENRHVDEVLAKIPELTEKTYVPGGCTALYDAIGSTVAAIEKKGTNAGKVLTVILTDGLENSSREYSLQMIRDLISRKEKEGNWTFVFLGAGLDAFQTGDMLGVAAQNAVAYDPKFMTQQFHNTAHATMCYADSSVTRSTDFYKSVSQRKMMAARMSVRRPGRNPLSPNGKI